MKKSLSKQNKFLGLLFQNEWITEVPARVIGYLTRVAVKERQFNAEQTMPFTPSSNCQHLTIPI